MPFQSSKKQDAKLACQKFSSSTYSDHISELRLFQIWQNDVSGTVKGMVVEMWTQLLGQFWASGFVKARGSGDMWYFRARRLEYFES